MSSFFFEKYLQAFKKQTEDLTKPLEEKAQTIIPHDGKVDLKHIKGKDVSNDLLKEVLLYHPGFAEEILEKENKK